MKKEQWNKILNENTLITEDKVDRVAGVVSSYLLRIADDIVSVTDLLDQNDTDEMKEKLIAALPSREPKSSDYHDAFASLDIMAAQKIAKFYRELARGLKK